MKTDTLGLQLFSFDGRIPAELSADYILPDIFPDVKRILRVSAKPILLGRYYTGKKIEFDGAVDYVVIFSAEGESGETIHSVHFAADFRCELTDAEEQGDAEVIASPIIGGCSARLVNPRKLALRSTVLTDVRIARRASCEPRLDGSEADRARLERLTETVPALIEKMLPPMAEQFSENLEPDASQPPIDALVNCDAEVRFHEARLFVENEEMAVALKGFVLVDCIYRATDGSFRSFARKIPLALSCKAEGITSYFANCAESSITCGTTAYLTELNASVSENGVGEKRVLELDLSYETHLHFCGVTEVPLVSDAYSTTRAAELSMRELSYCSGAKQLCANFSVGETLPLEPLHLPEGCVPFDARGSVVFNSVTAERGRAIVAGEATLSCIFIASDGSYLAAEPVIPVRCELPLGLNEPLSMDAQGAVTDLRIRLSDRLYADFEVSLEALIRERTRRSTVDEIRLGALLPSADCSGMTICYPAGESLWQISKRYHVSADAMQAANPAPSRVLRIPHPTGVSGII